MVQVEEKRLAELLREEWKLNALEVSGVDDWDGMIIHYIQMKKIHGET